MKTTSYLGGFGRENRKRRRRRVMETIDKLMNFLDNGSRWLAYVAIALAVVCIIIPAVLRILGW
jgi:hypothetical protein